MIDIFTANPWQMTLGERSALEGVLSALKPRLAVEIGTAEGGSLRRIATHSREVHSFDLVEPSPEVRALDNVTLHTGDSRVLLPAFLAECSDRGDNVDFVLVDGDHSAEGVRADLENLLASPAIHRAAIVIHDTLNEEVRRGIEAVDLAASRKVSHRDFDFVPGHLSHGGAYDLQLWGGLGLILVDADAPSDADGGAGFYSMLELLLPLREALAAAAARGRMVQPEAIPALVEAGAASDPATEQAVKADLAAARETIVAYERSLSWRLTAPLRAAARRLRERRIGG